MQSLLGAMTGGVPPAAARHAEIRNVRLALFLAALSYAAGTLRWDRSAEQEEDAMLQEAIRRSLLETSSSSTPGSSGPATTPQPPPQPPQQPPQQPPENPDVD